MRRTLGLLLGLVVRLWLSTLRLTLIVDPALEATRPRPWVLVFWHGQQLALLRWVRWRRVVALVSQSQDGELVAGVLGRLGIACARGSSSRGGREALEEIVRRMEEGRDAVIAVDGPKGPARVAKWHGAAAAARRAGGVVVPMAAACSRRWVVAKAWDGFEVPLPFTGVVVALGAPVEAERAGEGIERARGVASLRAEPGRRAW